MGIETGPFIDDARAWICDGYSLDLRFISYSGANGYELWGARVSAHPLPPIGDRNFVIQAGQIFAGQVQLANLSEPEVMSVLERAADGLLIVEDREMRLLAPEVTVQKSSSKRTGSEFIAALRLNGVTIQNPVGLGELDLIDDRLRECDIPFDGLADLSAYLGLGQLQAPQRTFISIEVNPPVDIILAECGLLDGKLRLVIHANPKARTEDVTLAISAYPADGTQLRRQLAADVIWDEQHQNGRRAGRLEVSLPGAVHVHSWLQLGRRLLRRHWFVDPLRSVNARVTAVMSVDRDLSKLRSSLIDAPVTKQNAQNFETAVAHLLFLLGFSATQYLETDAPDVIFMTPGGRLGIVECTLKVGDFEQKIGKLVARRGEVQNALRARNYPFDVVSILVCALPRLQIASTENVVRHKVILLAREDIESGLNNLSMPTDPDKLVIDALAILDAQASSAVQK